VRAAILAVRPAAIADEESEVATLADEDLARWRRDAAPVTTSAIPNANDGDGRWLWALALGLLGVEAWIRRSSARVAGGSLRAGGEAHADAA
jgi:hypothetical protein